MKRCIGCNNTLDPSCFYRNNNTKDKLSTRCKECTRIGNLAARHRRQEHYSSVALARRRERADKYAAWKATQSCKFCKENAACCLDLHHLNPQEKEQAIGDIMSTWSWARLTKELAKCIVVCRNCHAKIHDGLLKLDDSTHGA